MPPTRGSIRVSMVAILWSGLLLSMSYRADRNPATGSALLPIEHDFTGVAGLHQLNRFLELGIGKPVGDDGGDVQPALNQGRHLIPRFIHLPSVDALNR